jgi:hypothetical protein
LKKRSSPGHRARSCRFLWRMYIKGSARNGHIAFCDRGLEDWQTVCLPPPFGPDLGAPTASCYRKTLSHRYIPHSLFLSTSNKAFASRSTIPTLFPFGMRLSDVTNVPSSDIGTTLFNQQAVQVSCWYQAIIHVASILSKVVLFSSGLSRPDKDRMWPAGPLPPWSFCPKKTDGLAEICCEYRFSPHSRSAAEQMMGIRRGYREERVDCVAIWRLVGWNVGGVL